MLKAREGGIVGREGWKEEGRTEGRERVRKKNNIEREER